MGDYGIHPSYVGLRHSTAGPPEFERWTRRKVGRYVYGRLPSTDSWVELWRLRGLAKLSRYRDAHWTCTETGIMITFPTGFLHVRAFELPERPPEPAYPNPIPRDQMAACLPPGSVWATPTHACQHAV